MSGTAWTAARRAANARRRNYRPAPRFKVQALRDLAPPGIPAVGDDDDEVVAAASAAGFPAVLADWVPRERRLREAQDREVGHKSGSSGY